MHLLVEARLPGHVSTHCSGSGAILKQVDIADEDLERAGRCFLLTLERGSYKAQWNVCYALTSLLRVPRASEAMHSRALLPDLLNRTSQIAAASSNFKAS